ncbi:unnamed protein product [Lactuca virosa]|uniref:Uncharacterized protein n=1 Tax=Lactuca virosa TaxID=75947 RepID=A0AAU9MR57_9ASTR|nr:unnamed protein product [Lactuca virosa]
MCYSPVGYHFQVAVNYPTIVPPGQIIRFEIAQRLLTAKLVTDLQPTAYRALPSFKAASTLLLREKFTVAISLLPSPPITGDTGYSLAFSGLLTERI